MQNAPPKSDSATQGHGSLEWSMFSVFFRAQYEGLVECGAGRFKGRKDDYIIK